MRRLLSVALVSSLVFGCGDSFSPEGLEGSYTLESVNGQDLPFSEIIGGATIEITAGQLNLNSNSTWSVSITASLTEGGTTISETDTDSGTFTLVEPSTIRFTDSDGDTFAATRDGSNITFIFGGDTLTFRK